MDGKNLLLVSGSSGPETITDVHVVSGKGTFQQLFLHVHVRAHHPATHAIKAMWVPRESMLKLYVSDYWGTHFLSFWLGSLTERCNLDLDRPNNGIAHYYRKRPDCSGSATHLELQAHIIGSHIHLQSWIVTQRIYLL